MHFLVDSAEMEQLNQNREPLGSWPKSSPTRAAASVLLSRDKPTFLERLPDGGSGMAGGSDKQAGDTGRFRQAPSPPGGPTESLFVSFFFFKIF